MHIYNIGDICYTIENISTRQYAQKLFKDQILLTVCEVIYIWDQIREGQPEIQIWNSIGKDVTSAILDRYAESIMVSTSSLLYSVIIFSYSRIQITESSSVRERLDTWTSLNLGEKYSL